MPGQPGCKNRSKMLSIEALPSQSLSRGCEVKAQLALHFQGDNFQWGTAELDIYSQCRGSIDLLNPSNANPSYLTYQPICSHHKRYQRPRRHLLHNRRCRHRFPVSHLHRQNILCISHAVHRWVQQLGIFLAPPLTRTQHSEIPS